MNGRILTILGGLVGAAVLVLGVAAAEPPAATPAAADSGIFDQDTVLRGTDAPVTQPGVQPQGRGPVHEAFAAPTVDRPRPGPVVPKQPPAAVEELPPAEKPEGDDVQWISGYWGWDDERSDFLWVTGIWRALPPGRQWVPGHWAQVQGGWQFAPGFWAAADGGDVQVVPAPPDPLPETPPPAPAVTATAPAPAGATAPAATTTAPAGAAAAPTTDSTADSTYVPGNYVYQDNQFVWQAGYYVPNRPGFIWVPARYVWTPAGYVFVDGYWDYDLANRGLLFAPVVIDPQTLGQAGWVYTPAYVVHDLCLLDALFVRTDSGCYFFGDYFDPGYAQLGFVNWLDYRVNRQGLDPLFGYYRWSHRNDRAWERRVRAIYTARGQGNLVRPPRNLAAQQALGQRLRAGNAGRLALQHSIMLAPVGKVDRKVVRLQKLDRAGQLKQRKVAADLQRNVGQQREQLENKLLAQGQGAIRPGGTAQKLALNLAKSTTVARPGAGRTPPPPLPVDRKRTQPATANAGGNRPGVGTVATDLKAGRTNPVNGNVAGTPPGTKLNANPQGAKVNANGPVGAKLNATPGNTPAIESVTRPIPGTGNAAGNPGAGNAAGAPVNAKVNPNGPVGGRVNVTPGNGAGTPGGRKPVDGTTELKVDRPARTPATPAPAGDNGASRLNGRVERGERNERPVVTEQPPALPSRVNQAANVGALRQNVVNNPAPQGDRVQRAFTPPSGPRVNNPTPQQFATPPSRPVQTFSTPPQNVARPAAGGGGRRR